MKKLKLALLGIVSIFCLNSCISALIATATTLCGENGCNDIIETKDNEYGIRVYEEKELNKSKEYINLLNLRKKYRLEIQQWVSVSVPEGFILKKRKDYRYFYDKKKNVGFPIYVDNDYYIRQAYNGEKSIRYNITERISTNNGVSTYKIKDEGYNKLLLIKKLSEDMYIHVSVRYKDSPILERFYKDFMENL